MMGFGFGGFGMLLVIIFWVGVIAAAIWFVARLFPQMAGRSMQGTGPWRDLPAPSPEEILKERFARGEISKDQYDQMRQTLASTVLFIKRIH